MKQKRMIKLSIVFLFLLLVLPLVSSATRSNPQYTQYMGQGESSNDSVCREGQDFLIQIAPFGCTPAVVRSDLLEEQNVPVFCQLSATKVNPLIDVEAIDSISFSGEYPLEVEGLAFHPAQAALGLEGNLNSPVLNNIGYVVIVLKKQANSSAMPEYVSGNLTAKVKYDVQSTLGIGKANFYLPELTDADWEKSQYQYSFWEGKGTVRAENIDENKVSLSIYSKGNKVSSVTLNEGGESEKIYLPGFDCLASLQVKLNGLENPSTRALLRVNADVVEVADGEKFLENKCQVTSLKKQGLTQNVKIKCIEDEGVNSFNLIISPRVNLSIDGVENEFGLGDSLYDIDEGKKSVYLAYIGAKGDSQDVNNLFVFLMSSPEHKERLSESELARYNFLVGDLLEKNSGWDGAIDEGSNLVKKIPGILPLLANFVIRGEEFHWVNYGGVGRGFADLVIVNGFVNPQDKILSGDPKKYYGLATADYETIAESFSGERYTPKIAIPLDEEALYKKILFSWSLQQKATVLELCGEFKNLYSNSDKELEKYCDDEYKLSNQETASVYVTINGNVKEIIFDGIYEPSAQEYGAKIFVSNTLPAYDGEKDLRKNQEVYVSATESIILKELEEDYAIFDVSKINYENIKEITYNPKNLKIELGDYAVIGENNYKINLEGINLKKFAKVSISPGFEDSGTTADFGFNIGIEQRAIELSPEVIAGKIENLDSELGTWQNISDGLETVVKGLKVACIATGAALTIKNLLANAGGEGIARNYVMRGAGGWYERCADMVGSGTYISQEQCLIKKAVNIDADVSTLSGLISKQNEKIQEIEKATVKTETFGNTVVDTKEFMIDYSEQVISSLDSEQLGELDPYNTGKTINMEDMKISLSIGGWEEGNYNKEQLREIELYSNVLKEDSGATDELRSIAEKELYSTLLDVQTTAGSFVERTTIAGTLGIDPGKIGLYETKDTKKIKYEEVTYGDIAGEVPIGGLNPETPIQVIQYEGGTYVVVLDDSSGTGILPIKRINEGEEMVSSGNFQIYDLNGKLVEDPEEHVAGLKNIYFQKYDSLTYENEYKNAELQYYETEPYKGLPAIVPFDEDEGWYVATKQTLPVLGNVGAYDDSGAANSFWICNVGKNGLEENIGGDDSCQMINLGTRQPFDQFGGLDPATAEKLVSQAEKAVAQASSAYGSNMPKKVDILGTAFEVGAPAANLLGIECADLMSPKDCQLLFNVCDPVICPSSRCDLGGAYPVRDVVQTGVIGSLVLCLPNIQEGIFMPICLTGVKAGIDGWISVRMSYRDCLQNALDTGEMVGICDEIYSIYICEFFWRQALPLANLAIPQLVSAVMGQNARGGGEYLSVENAWKTAGDSVTYFTQYYGANALEAFKSRTSEEVGTEICKVSISAVYASGADLLDTISEPDSPSQFHGRFDEIPFSSATVPATSQYKVFYHIYAGQDAGAYYQVYLQGIPESSYYQDSSATLTVASGYIEAGGYATETVDQTAVSGYQELCINVDGQEECGFGEVSTSFAIDYATDIYVASQVDDVEISKESKCVGDSNLGIIRVCATYNPGEGSDPYVGTENSRWKEVGYCGVEEILCWLDTDSVGDAIEVATIEADALGNVTQNYLDILREKEGYLTEEEFVSKVEKINKEGKIFRKLVLIEEIFDKVFLNKEKAYLYLLRGNAYAMFLGGDLDEDLVEAGEETEEDPFIARYKKVEGEFPDGLFEYYAKENKPTDWGKNRFKGLLVAIAERQSNLGDPDPTWIMEYGNREEMYEGAENQVKFASSTLKLALNKVSPEGSNYKVCEGKADTDLLLCVVSVYLTGQDDEEGRVYAQEVIDRISFWENYFDKNGEQIAITFAEARAACGSPSDFRYEECMAIFGVEEGDEEEEKDEEEGEREQCGDGECTRGEICGSVDIPPQCKSDCGECGDDEEVIAPEEVIQRYLKIEEEFKVNGWSLFEYYSAKNKPDILTKERFKALLVAIAEKQSNLGYPEGKYDSAWLMEYGYKYAGTQRVDESEGAIKQVALASEVLNVALNGDRDSESPYYECRNKWKIRDIRLTCVVEVYLTNDESKPLDVSFGEQYAEEIIDRMDFWEEYFIENQ